MNAACRRIQFVKDSGAYPTAPLDRNAGNHLKLIFHFKKRPGDGTPMILAVVLVLLILFCGIAEYSRVWIIAQGVKEAAQQAVLSTVNDNYDDVYHAVREGYAAGWLPDDSGGWAQSVDEGNVYTQLSRILGLTGEGESYAKYTDGQMEFLISDLTVEIQNNGLSSGQSAGYTAIVELHLEIPVRFLSVEFPAAEMTLHTKAKYIPLF